jgi:glycosyltransferase involved in cell wall biosynthesis
VSNVLAQYRISEGARRVFVVPNGVDDSFFKSNLKDRIPSKLIYIGYVDLDRGVDIPIYCLRQLSQKIKGIKYIIVGDGPAITSLQLLSKELKVSSMIEFYGVVSRNNIIQILSKCGIGLALYSKRSHAIWGLSLKVLEYLASGLPVIVSPYISNANEIQAEKCGIIVRNIEELCSAIETLNDPKIYRFYSIRARNYAKRFRWLDIFNYEFALIQQFYALRRNC